VSRVDEAYHKILSAIVRGERPGGSELKSTQLARELGVSRTPVVLALQRLAADGIVEQVLNKRAVVRQGAENWLLELHELRELLEPEAAKLAAGKLTPDQIERLQQMATAATPGSHENWRDAAREFDFALHLAIAQRCGNLVLEQTIRKCWSYKRLSYEAGQDTPESLAAGHAEHLQVLEALKSGDEESAKAAMRLHLLSAAKLRPATRIV
jgi:DNA-binding GntR family transcriptional regulator